MMLTNLELKVGRLAPNISQKVYPVEKLQEFAYKVNYLDKRKYIRTGSESL